MSGSLWGLPLVFNGLVECVPRLVEPIEVDVGACDGLRSLAQEVGQPVARLYGIGPMNLDAEVLRHVPMVFNALAALFEGIALQRSVLEEEQLVVDVPSGEVLVQHLKHLQIEVFQAIELHQFAIGYKFDGIVSQHRIFFGLREVKRG